MKVGLCGESVAAGYLLAPAWTPAKAIEEGLGRHLGRAPSVLDLSRTNERCAGLVEAVGAACREGVELVVLFAGNNWALLEAPELSPLSPSAADRRHLGELLGDGGIEALVDAATRRAIASVGSALSRIAEETSAAGARVLAVIPEVNLADWASDQPAPWLAGGSVARDWHRLLRTTEGRLASSDLVGAVRAAKRMVLTDGGTTPSGLRRIGLARWQQGRTERAGAAFREAVDRSSYPLAIALPVPQIASWGIRLWRRFAAQRGWTVVDLPRLFSEAGGPPGRELFFDYCHLTERGIAAVADAVAKSAAPLLAGPHPGTSAFGDEPLLPPLPGSALARARLGAAIHNARRFAGCGKGEVVGYWTREAIAASTKVIDTMVDLAEARTAPIDPALTPAATRNRESTIGLGPQHGWESELLDGCLLAAWHEVLGEVDPARAELLARLLVERCAVDGEWRELATVAAVWEPHALAYPDLLRHDDLPERAFLRAIWPTIELCLVARAPAEVEVAMTLRLPAVPGRPERRRGRVRLALDGCPVAAFVVGERWSSRQLRVTVPPAGRPVRRLAFHWPLPPPADPAALAAVAARWRGGLEGWIHPAFGDLYSVRVRRV